jgi:hypothetical protein
MSVAFLTQHLYKEHFLFQTPAVLKRNLCPSTLFKDAKNKKY